VCVCVMEVGCSGVGTRLVMCNLRTYCTLYSMCMITDRCNRGASAEMSGASDAACYYYYCGGGGIHIPTVCGKIKVTPVLRMNLLQLQLQSFSMGTCAMLLLSKLATEILFPTWEPRMYQRTWLMDISYP